MSNKKPPRDRPSEPSPATTPSTPPTERQLDDALADSFPASDPVSFHSEGAEPPEEAVNAEKRRSK